MIDNNIKINSLPWTGERYLPNIHGNIELEHLHRYLFARRLSLGKRVLDIASGEGYGSALLAQNALNVVGVDVAAEAVDHAKSRYQADNLEFKVGSCSAIPLPDNCVDIVVSFETIEHHFEHDKMMSEVKRVLVPGGLLVISSPDKLEYSDRTDYDNPYHVRELYRAEFESLLSTYFKNYHIAGQRVIYGSAIFSEEDCGRVRSFDFNDKLFLTAKGVSRALYLVAVASDAELPIPESGILEQVVSESEEVREGIRQINTLNQAVTERDGQIATLNQAVTERDEQIATLNQAVTERDEQIATLNQAVTERDGQIATLNQAVTERDGQIANLDHAVAERDGQIANLNHAVTERDNRIDYLTSVESIQSQEIRNIINSKSWLITKPFRFLSFLINQARKRTFLLYHRKSIQLQSEDRSNLPEDFDRSEYLKLNPDLTEEVDPEIHYLAYGCNENRIYSLKKHYNLHLDHQLNECQKTILIVSHEASRTGAPILCLNLARALAEGYNVVVYLLKGGQLLEAFFKSGASAIVSSDTRGNQFLANAIINQLCDEFIFDFALISSIESSLHVLPSLAKNNIFAINLIHEFASCYARPKEVFKEMCAWPGEMVFSTKLTLEDALLHYPEICNRMTHVFPQGKCQLPLDELTIVQLENERERIRRLMRPEDNANKLVVVLGAGSVHWRKGIDLFIQCAAKVVQASNSEIYRFVWIGKSYDSEMDLGYSIFLKDQIRRAGLEEFFILIEETPAIETAYEEADLFVLSSRLDPLPNVAIDVMSYSVPVLCFAQTTGIANFLIENGLEKECVSEYLDSKDLAEKILRLGGLPSFREQIGSRCREISADYFDMNKYVINITDLFSSKEKRTRQDFETICNSGLFNQNYICPPNKTRDSLEVDVLAYLCAWENGIDRRKPFAGFHPGIYREQQKLSFLAGDPLANYIRAGCPDGPWNFPVIINSENYERCFPKNNRIALHIHVFYPELLSEISDRLVLNHIAPDLFISISNSEYLDVVYNELKNYKGNVIEIKSVPNKGRDIGPFLTEFIPKILDKYDYVGHFHTKKSVHAEETIGKSWYFFLLENLIGGGSGCMMDNILSQMEKYNSYGMVFPDDPNVLGWGPNRSFAETFASRLGIHFLPENFIFPVGTMFWARTDALQPMLNLNMDWEDYPDEPLPIDGTALHALERLFPCVIKSQNYQIASTSVIGLSR